MDGQNIENKNQPKKDSIIQSLINAGYERAASVYNLYLADPNYFDEGEYCCRPFLSDGRPNPRHMIIYAWPDNLNQIILDEDFVIDSSIFPDYKGYTNMGYTMDYIEPYISYSEIVEAIEIGAKKFIKEKYPYHKEK